VIVLLFVLAMGCVRVDNVCVIWNGKAWIVTLITLPVVKTIVGMLDCVGLAGAFVILALVGMLVKYLRHVLTIVIIEECVDMGSVSVFIIIWERLVL
jgi:hypothetical protein